MLQKETADKKYPIRALLTREPIESNLRNSGRTTRLVDELIQKLFSDGKVFARDHYQTGRDNSANRALWMKTVRRLKIEHSHINIKVSERELLIELL